MCVCVCVCYFSHFLHMFQVLVAFMVGMTNLYRYYGNHIVDQVTNTPASQTFKGSVCLLCFPPYIIIYDSSQFVYFRDTSRFLLSTSGGEGDIN